MQADFFAILGLRPGRYDRQFIDRRYRSVRQEIMRSEEPNRLQRLDDALIARCVLSNPARQEALLRRQFVGLRRRRRRLAMPVARRPARVSVPARPPGTRVFSSLGATVCPPVAAPGARPGTAGAGQDVHAWLADQVRGQLEDGLLRFTARRRLLARAAGAGIGAFKANLIIAEVLHDVRVASPVPRHDAARTPARPAAARERYGLRLASAMLIAGAVASALIAWLLQ